MKLSHSGMAKEEESEGVTAARGARDKQKKGKYGVGGEESRRRCNKKLQGANDFTRHQSANVSLDPAFLMQHRLKHLKHLSRFVTVSKCQNTQQSLKNVS